MSEELQVATQGALEVQARVEIESAVATAKRFPRDVVKFQKSLVALVQLDQQIAESCIYRRPVGKKNGVTEFAEGKSVRLAELAASQYGNLIFRSEIIADTGRTVTARGWARDLESNTAAQVDVVESTVTTDGRNYSDRMRVVVAKAAASKALRDAVFRVVPPALLKPVEEAARRVIAGNQAPIGQRREAVRKWVAKLGIDVERVWASLGVNGVEGLMDDHLETLQGIRTALKDGDTTIDEAFPELVKEASTPPPKRQTAPKQEAPPEPEPTPQPEPEKNEPAPAFDPNAESTVLAIMASVGATEEHLLKCLERVGEPLGVKVKTYAELTGENWATLARRRNFLEKTLRMIVAGQL